MSPPNLTVEFGRLRLRNPLVGASGTVGYGEEISAFQAAASFGAIIGKSLSLEPRRGNPPPRTCETPGGMLNSIGLENKGFAAFRDKLYPRFRELDTVRIASIAGESVEEYRALAEGMAGLDAVDAIEVNLSCPNVAKGGLEFARDPGAIGTITAAVRETFPRPIWIKLSPNVSDIVPLGRAAADAGADALTACNTYVGLSVDWRRRRPVLGGTTGGFSGPAVKPLVLHQVRRLHGEVGVPIVASGGATTAGDVLEFLVAGASAVQIGTAHFLNPAATGSIASELPRLLETEGIDRIADLIGTLRPPARE